MRFGGYIPHYGIPTSKFAVSDFCTLAERLMFDSVWTTDHVAVSEKYPDPYGIILESLVTLGYAAARTEHVKLGTSIIVLSIRNPVWFAKQVASLDVLSNGRIILSLGVGWMEDEFSTLNANFNGQGEIMNEQIRLLKALWTQDKPQFEGRFFKVRDVIFKQGQFKKKDRRCGLRETLLLRSRGQRGLERAGIQLGCSLTRSAKEKRSSNQCLRGSGKS